MNLRKNRAFAFVMVSIAYLLAIVAGVVCYHYLPFAFWLNLLMADILATVVVFIFSVAFKNASFYDPYWSVQPIVILVALACKYSLSGASVLPFIAVMVWGIRLTANWAYTFKDLNWQDWRYTMLKEKTGKFYPIINFVGIHLVPTLVVYGCILPAAFRVWRRYQRGQRTLFRLVAGGNLLAGDGGYPNAPFPQNRDGRLYPRRAVEILPSSQLLG